MYQDWAVSQGRGQYNARMNPLRILYNGWSFCHAPNHPATLHILTILAYLPEEIQAVIAFPDTPPPWTPSHVQVHVEPVPRLSRLQWEQRTLPALRQELEAHLLHLTTETASLLNAQATVISPTQPGDMPETQPEGTPRPGLIPRLRAALAAGGTARTQAIFWPEDLPPRAGGIPLPPIVHPAFTPDEPPEPHIPGVKIPETFVLCHTEDIPGLHRALEAWTWAAAPIGETYPLVFLGLREETRKEVETMAATLGIQDTIVALPALPPGWIASLYQRAAVVFHPAPASAWGGAVRYALACGKPLVGIETARASAIVGPAAVLVDAGDTRRLGASVIGAIVKEVLAARLREAALARTGNWRDAKWGLQLADMYRRISS